WGSGILSSSDGQRFPVSGKTRHARPFPPSLGYGMGITFYSWSSDQLSQYGTKYVHPLTDEQRAFLEKTMKYDGSPRARARAHSLLLSVQGMVFNDICKFYQVDRDSVCTWMTKWEDVCDESVLDHARSGRWR